MARSSEQNLRQRRRKRLLRGLLIGGAALGIPAVINSVLSHRAKRLPAPKWGDPEVFSWQGHAVTYQDLGQGPTVVLLHSFGPGHTGALWREVAEDLAQHHRVIVPDLLGWGESDRPRIQYDAELYIRLLIHLLGTVLDEPAAVGGVGLSCSHAIQVAVDHPDLVKALALFSPLGIDLDRDEPDLKDAMVHRLLRLPVLGTSALNVFASENGVRNHLRENFYDLTQITDERIEEHYRSAHLPGAHTALAAWVSGYLNHGIRHLLQRLDLPTLLVWGRESENPSLASADLWLHQLQEPRFEILDQCANLPQVEDPTGAAAILLDFLAEPDRFAANMAGIFKAYDVRGIFPDELNEDIAYRIGRAFPALLEANGAPTVVVGRDMRSHSIPLREALVRGLVESGALVKDIGLATTPMNYFAVGKLKADGGTQITASHNPAQYNGVKFSLREARPVSGDDGIPQIERRVQQQDFPVPEATGSVEKVSITDDYASFNLGHLKRPANGRKLKVVVDAANGMGVVYRDLLEQAGIELDPLYFELDGSFPNHEANPLKEENLLDLSDRVCQTGADLGVAFDGDADRAGFVDETGQPVGSDLMTALIAAPRLEQYPGGAVVYDVRSSRAVSEYIEEHGGRPLRERVGHSFIKATLRKNDGSFGGELAGHYYFRENYFADSSLLAVFSVLNLLWAENKTLSQLVAPLRRYAKSGEINFRVRDKEAKMEELVEHYDGGELDRLDGISIDFPDWWFNVRPSNTEPLLRLVLEAQDAAALEQRKAELIALIGDPV